MAPSHRADEPPGSQAPAPGKQARLVHTDRTDRSGRGARMRCPGASVLCLSPPLIALLLTRLAIRSGQSHPGLYTQHNRTSPVAVEEPPSSRDPTNRLSYGGARAIRDSPSDVGACHRVVRSHRALQALLGPVASPVARFDGVFGADWSAWAPSAACACLARVDCRVTGEQVCLRTTRWHAATSEGESRIAQATPSAEVQPQGEFGGKLPPVLRVFTQQPT